MEIWGGNRAIDKCFEAPGLDIYVHSAPYKDSQAGGGDTDNVKSGKWIRLVRVHSSNRD